MRVDVAEGFSLPLCFLKKDPAKGTHMGTKGGIRLMGVSFEELMDLDEP